MDVNIKTEHSQPIKIKHMTRLSNIAELNISEKTG